MPLIRHANNFTASLTADPGAAGTTLDVTSAAGLPSLAAPSTGLVTPQAFTYTQPVIPLLIESEIVYVTAISATTLTVLRGREGTAAAAHAAGIAVSQIITRDGMLNNSHPGAVNVTLAIATGQTYTVDLNYKYHFITLGGSTSFTVSNTTTGGITPELGHEVRFHFQVTATLGATQPTWGTQWAPVPNLQTGTAVGQTSVSFAYKGQTGTAAALWRRIQ